MTTRYKNMTPSEKKEYHLKCLQASRSVERVNQLLTNIKALKEAMKEMHVLEEDIKSTNVLLDALEGK